MSSTIILKCKCHHDFQDKKYGKGNRVHNTGKELTRGWLRRCTVCGDEKEV